MRKYLPHVLIISFVLLCNFGCVSTYNLSNYLRSSSELQTPEELDSQSKVIWSVLSKFEHVDFYLYPGIPAKKEKNARLASKIPNDEVIIALVNHAVWGSAKNHLVFAKKGIYFRNDWTASTSGAFFFPYSRFPSAKFKPSSRAYEVSIVGFANINSAGSVVPRNLELEMLNQVAEARSHEEHKVYKRDVTAQTTGGLRPQGTYSGGSSGHSHGTYPGGSSGHWILENIDAGSMMVLEDNSVWEIDPLDKISESTFLWLLTSEITIVTSNSGSPGYDYLLINADDGGKPHAKFLGWKNELN
jgi:hypothetical protein